MNDLLHDMMAALIEGQAASKHHAEAERKLFEFRRFVSKDLTEGNQYHSEKELVERTLELFEAKLLKTLLEVERLKSQIK